MSGLQPAPMTIKFGPFSMGDAGSGDWSQIDVSQCVSMITRRAMPQGLEWAIAGIRISATANMNLQVMTLPSGWIAANAWNAGFRSWERQLREAEEAQDHEVPRAAYRDFKIAFDYNDVDGTDQAIDQWMPSGFPIPSMADTTYEWDHSLLTVPEDPSGTVTTYRMPRS